MFKKILDVQDNLIVLCGIYFALRFIITKEIYIHDIFGIKINTFHLLILTIVSAVIHRVYTARDEETSKEIQSK
jgi:uncharacterized membrane protein